jgi:hypothetical protein
VKLELGYLGVVEGHDPVRYERQPVHLRPGFLQAGRLEDADHAVAACSGEGLADQALPLCAQFGEDAFFFLQKRTDLLRVSEGSGGEEIQGDPSWAGPVSE